MTVYDFDLHDTGKAAFQALQGRALRGTGTLSRYNPTDSSLTRQAWAYQEKLTDMMGEGLDDADPMALAPSGEVESGFMARLSEVGIDKKILSSCGAGIVAAGLAGYATGKVGILSTAAGVGVAYLVLKSLERK